MNTENQSSERPVELVAVINSFNRRNLLEGALASLSKAFRESRFNFAIVVFDAGSTDGSREFLANWSSQNPQDNLVLLTPSDNRSSFAQGVNIACATAFERFPQCRWLFFYETDNWLAGSGPLEKAVALLESESSLAAAGFTVRKHGGAPFGYGMRFPSTLSFGLGQNLSAICDLHAPNASAWKSTDGIRWRTCDVVFTSPLLVRRQAWAQTGGFDDEAFAFSDSDLDWAWRCAKLGWKMAVIDSADVVHDNREQQSAWSANRTIDFHRNRFRLLKRHRGKHVALLKPVLFVRHGLEAVMLMLKSGVDPSAKEKLAKRRQMLRTVWNNYS